MILVDTSAWIDFFRNRDPLASAVDRALQQNDAALCGPIETELRRGFLNARDVFCYASAAAACANDSNVFRQLFGVMNSRYRAAAAGSKHSMKNVFSIQTSTELKKPPRS
jgi:hypothetical protein